MKRFLGTLLLVLAVLLFSAPVFAGAAEGDEYEYTVRVYAGAKGTFTDGTTVKELKCKYNEEVNLEQFTVNVSEAKYQFYGYRLSGKDNDTVSSPVFSVKEDVDYVVAYSIVGLPTTYTVNFVDSKSGKTLAESKTYKGNVGDKPIAGYLYIEGYRPLYRNITKTLSEDSSENVFTFEYVESTSNSAANAGESGNGSDSGSSGTTGGNGTNVNSGSANQRTQDLLDLDTYSPKTGQSVNPQSNVPTGANGAKTASTRSYLGWIIAGGCVVLAGIAGFLAYYFRMRSKRR